MIATYINQPAARPPTHTAKETLMNERTPAGGDRSEIIYLDEEGAPVATPNGAVEAVIREYVGGVMIKRTYMELNGSDLPKWTNPGSIGTEPETFDFAKNTWDVFVSEDGIYRLVTALPDLFKAMGIDGINEGLQRDALLSLMTKPSWDSAPADLKADAATWLATR